MNEESLLIEYKRELSDSFVRAVVGFLNSNTGGHIYIGVSNDGQTFGVRDTDIVQRQVTDRILNNISPNVLGLFEVVSEERDGKDIVHVIVSGGMEKPYYLKQKGMTPDGCFEHPLVDPVALREAVINAVVHNDYTREVPPLFEIFSDRMEMTTYGGLVEGLSKEEFLNCCSMPRNRELMRVFHDLDMVEQLGSGMRRILRAYDEHAFSFSDHFMRTSFYFVDNEKEINNDRINDRTNDTINDRTIDTINLSDTESLIFSEIKRDPYLSGPKLMQLTGLSEPTINRAFKKLKEIGLIVRVGANKNGHWKICRPINQ